MMRFCIYFILVMAFKALAKLLAPILPAFATMQFGPGAGWREFEVGPRLPVWLDWFMMDDHSLWGGEEWRTKIQPKRWNTYLGMVLWLLRNSGVNFDRHVLSVSLYDKKAWQKRGRWQVIPSLAIETNFGWKLDAPQGFPPRCGFVASIKFKVSR